MDLGGPAGSHLLLKMWKDKIMGSWVLIILASGSWLAYPLPLETKEQCDQGYSIVAKEFEAHQVEKPSHICAQVVDINQNIEPKPDQPED